jgi:hypothetical protein
MNLKISEKELYLPTLSIIAKSIFVIQASSSSSERIFSLSGQLIEDRRTCLNTEIVSSLLFCHNINKNNPN